MRKKTILLATLLIVLALVFIITMVLGARPFKKLSADEVASISVFAIPPEVTVLVEDRSQIQEIVRIINKVKTYEKSEEWREYSGQYVSFTLTMESGEQLEIAAYNPFIVINGQGYKTKYEPCQELNAIANKIIQQ